jgi:hypothetical protein
VQDFVFGSKPITTKYYILIAIVPSGTIQFCLVLMHERIVEHEEHLEQRIALKVAVYL